MEKYSSELTSNSSKVPLRIFFTRFIKNLARNGENYLNCFEVEQYVIFQVGTLPTVIESEACLVMLWKHECTRVFSDRFTLIEDKKWFEDQMLNLIEEQLGSELKIKSEPTPAFVDFMR